MDTSASGQYYKERKQVFVDIQTDYEPHGASCSAAQAKLAHNGA